MYIMLGHCHEIVAARLYAVWLPEGARLLALTRDGEAEALLIDHKLEDFATYDRCRRTRSYREHWPSRIQR